jgi:hypothetical protein
MYKRQVFFIIMSRARRWRTNLLGTPDTIHRLRQYNVRLGTKSSYYDDIHNDLKRTYPLDDFFNDHIDDLSYILNTYAYVNDGMGYAQGMAFLVFILYKVYYKDDPTFAVDDTFYSLHNIIQLIRPAYPLNAEDTTVVKFNKHTMSTVMLLISKRNKPLAIKVKELNIMEIFICQNIPSLFGTKFNIDDCCIIWDFIINVPTQYNMFHRILCVIAGMILSIEPVIQCMSFESVMSIMQASGIYKVRRVLGMAHSVI